MIALPFAIFGHIEFPFQFLKIVQTIITTGLSLAVLVATPALAVFAPVGLAQTNRLEAIEEVIPRQSESASSAPLRTSTSSRIPSRLESSRDFVERVENAKRTEAEWRQVVAKNPRNAEAYRNLANALTDLNRYRDAEAIYQRSIQLDPTNEASYIALGQFLQTQTRLYEAAVLYQQMTEAIPNSAIAYEKLADSLSRVSTDDWPTLNTDIEMAYRQAIQIDPNQITSYYGLGAYLAGQDRFAEAMAVMREIIRLDPDNNRIYATLAAIPTLNQEPAAAAAIYREGLAAQPNNPDLYSGFANWLVHQGRTAEAKIVYQEALEQVPESGALIRSFAQYLTAVGQVEEAESLYRTAIEQDIVGDAETYVQLGDLLLNLNRTAEAKAIYEQAILLSPESDTYGKLGALLEATEGVDTAIALYRKAINKPRVGDKGYFYAQIGKLLQASGRTDDAISAYRQGLDLTDSVSLALPLANLLLAQEQYDEALSLYERFKSSFSDDPKTLQNWQAALRGLGRTAEAETLFQDLQPRLAKLEEGLYRRAIAISPESGYFYDLLGDTLSQQGKTAEAEAAYQEALRLNYGVFRTRVKLGRILFEQGELEQAEAIYLQAIDRTPQTDRQYFAQDRAQLYQHLGDLYEATNRPLLAIESYRKVIEIDPSKVSAREKLATLLAKIQGAGEITDASVETEVETVEPKE